VLSSRNSILSLVRFISPAIIFGGGIDSNQPLFSSARYLLGGLQRKRFRPIEIEGQYPSTSEESVVNQGRRYRFGGKSFIINPTVYICICLALKHFFSTAHPGERHHISSNFILNAFLAPSILFCLHAFFSIQILSCVYIDGMQALRTARIESNPFYLNLFESFRVNSC
jgi:hypothetical protein